MIHFCVFGGHGGPITPGKRLYVTIFGACEVKRPTMTKMILEARQAGHEADVGRGYFFVTIFGASEVKLPTLAEEYADLRDALASGALTLEDWDRMIARIGTPFRSASLTLFGGFDADSVPTEEEELDALALQRHLGHINEPVGNSLMAAIGQNGSNRITAIRKAAGAVRA